MTLFLDPSYQPLTDQERAAVTDDHLAHRERPTDAVRRMHRQERAAVEALRPRTGNVAVQPFTPTNDDGSRLHPRAA